MCPAHRPPLGLVALLAAQAWLAARSARNYATWPRLATRPIDGPVAPVAVIVPARDEAANLGRLIPALTALRPRAAELIVVDDRSRDGTAEIAAGLGARVLEGSEPPPAWTGKNWACHQGRRAARAGWLLFTDADTVHRPASLSSALAAAEATRADVLSLLPDQECRGFWERLLLPFAYGQYFAAAEPRWANDDRRAAALANGQYLLVRAELYDRVGGHSSVRGSVTEDVALARVLREAGARLRVLRADGQVGVRMYGSLGHLWEGFRKNSFNVLRANPSRGAIVAAATILSGLPLWLAWQAARGRAPLMFVGLSYLVAVTGYLPWLRWFGVPLRYAPLQPLAFATFQLIALDSTLRPLLGLPIAWKGRRYR